MAATMTRDMQNRRRCMLRSNPSAQVGVARDRVRTRTRSVYRGQRCSVKKNDAMTEPASQQVE
jgi:hypothetical protein